MMNFKNLPLLGLLGYGMVSVAIAILSATAARAAEDIVFADFEGTDYGPWKTEGTAFGNSPIQENGFWQTMPVGFLGRGLANSFHGGDRATGVLTSPEFEIERKYITFLIGGGYGKDTCINLIIDGKTVRTASGVPNGSQELLPAWWDASEFAGKMARIEIVDRATGEWGHILVDQIVFTDSKPPGFVENPSREMLAEKRWLYFPIKPSLTTRAQYRRVKVICDGKIVRRFSAELADGNPGWWSPLDITEWKGRKLVVQMDRLLENSDALKLLHQSDEWENAEELYHEPLRPQFHFTARRGWLNDPNGLAFYKGEYHLFFQHDPFASCSHASHWGHAVSKDLVHWEEVGEAIYPEEKGDIWSGSGVVDWKNTSGLGKDGKPPLVLFYTITDGFVQCMAYSNDGRTVTKGARVVPNVSRGNRDPKVFWYEPAQSWIMIFYAGFGKSPKEIQHTVQIYTSKNLREWKPASVVNGGVGDDHYLYECPDMFPLPVDGDPNNTKWVVTAATGEYTFGSFDGTTYIPETTKLSSRYGSAVYAAQTFSDEPKGRRIQIGWTVTFVPKMPFNQGMTIPLELTLRTTPEGPRLASWPVHEIEQLRRNSRTFPAGDLKDGENVLSGVRAELFDLETAIEPGSANKIVLNLRGKQLVYDTKTRILTYANFHAPLPLVNGALRLRVLGDRLSFEIFGANGLVYFPIASVNDSADSLLKLTAEGGTSKIIFLKLHEMASAWPTSPR